MTRTSALLALTTSLLAASLTHCGGTENTPAPRTPGQIAIANAGCQGCHGGDLSGVDTPLMGTMTYAPNLTPDMETGLGGWTDAQIIAAIRQGVDDEGAELCPSMPRYDMLSDTEVRAIVAHLRAIAAVHHTTPESKCDAPPEDAGADGGSDTGAPDASPEDTGVDATADAPEDTGADVVVEASVDAAMDAGADVRTDAAMDAGADVRTDAADARADVRADVAADVRTDAAMDAGADVRTDAGADVRTDAGADVRTDVPTDAPPLGCHPVINELVTGVMGAATHEWIELYNPCTAAISLSGWRLGYRAAAVATPITGADSATLIAFSTQSIPAGGYLLVAGAGYTGMNDGRTTAGMADAGGGIGLRNLAGIVVDSLGWGTATNAFVRVRAAAVAPLVAAPGNSLQRRPDGTDTGNNMNDFHAATRPTPRAANL